jgi:Uncharacterized conserved protein
MLLVSAFFHCKPHLKEAFFSEVQVLVKNTRNEPGCLNFSLYISAEDPNLYMLFEEWTGEEAIEVHKTFDYYKHFNQVASEYIEKKTIHAYPLQT